MKSRRTLMSLLTLLLISSGPALADVLLVDSIQSAPQIQTPRNGLTMSQVRQQYGSPTAEMPAVGDPPISRWEYNGFSVYFEHDLALHSVIHHPVNK
ncbi:MAG: hypothetical protein WBN81_08290 [Gammaproteobacteria bacterium]